VDALTLGHASADFNIPVKVLGTTPTLTVGDAGAEDTKIVFDGNAQDFYIGLDDSADDLVIGLGSTVGTTPAISINEDRDVTISDGAIDFDVASHDTSNGLKLGGTLVTATAAELNIMDGVTSTAAELNIMDGVTSTAAELNIMDGVTSTAAELNLLDGGTSVGSSITLADADGFVVNDGGTMKTIPATDIPTYVGGGITVAGQFRVTANFNGNADPITSNWEEVDTSYSRVGSAISESSGIFTMPSTGIYWIVFHSSVSYDGENSYHEAILQGTTDAFASDTHTLTSKYTSSSDHGATSYYGASCHAMYDVTNTSNNLIKCRVSMEQSGATTKGSSTNSQTSLTIMRLGDT